jgi:hypothetical protein
LSRLDVPLAGQVLYNTGDLLLRAFLNLELKDDHGNWHDETFRVDSGTPVTTMPAFHAKRMGLAIPANPSPITDAQTGLEVRSGYLRCRVAAMDGTEYAFPCFFLGDADAPPNLNVPAATVPRNLLGLSGVVDKIRWVLDGTPGLGAAWGHLIVERI